MMHSCFTKFPKMHENFTCTAAWKFLENFSCTLQKICAFSTQHAQLFASFCYHSFCKVSFFKKKSVTYFLWYVLQNFPCSLEIFLPVINNRVVIKIYSFHGFFIMTFSSREIFSYYVKIGLFKEFLTTLVITLKY